MSIIDVTIPSDSDEGTTMKVQAWFKKPGDAVTKNEPIVEMETDKVLLEIESPGDGVLVEILVETDAEVSPDMVIARIDTGKAVKVISNANDAGALDGHAAIKKQAEESHRSQLSLQNSALSPAVKTFVMEHNLDTTKMVGTGKNARITLKDAKLFLNKGSSLQHAEGSSLIQAEGSSSKSAEGSLSKSAEGFSLKPAMGSSPPLSVKRSGASEHVPHTSMRRSIAEHMSSSLSEAPHVTAVFEADFSAIVAHRKAHKEDFAKQDVKLTYTAYFLLACARAMQLVPEVNSQWHDDSLELFADVNVGVGTALGDKGLVVPVISAVQDKNLFEIARELQDISIRARENKLKPEDMRGGTFTISNHGVSGSLVATPIIINQPQSAILGIGKLEKRVVVRSVEGQDVMLIKPMAYVSLSIDHRVLDGHQTNTWLSEFVATLENWPSD